MATYFKGYHDPAGPLRLDAIRGMADRLIRNFVFLDYHLSYYEKERSTLVLFDDKGAVVAIYQVTTDQNHDHVNMLSSAVLDGERATDPNKAAWNIREEIYCEDHNFFPELCCLSLVRRPAFSDGSCLCAHACFIV